MLLFCFTLLGKCSSFGDLHFITFDRKWFDFNGICKYLMASDCEKKIFSVIIDNSGCSLKDSIPCFRAISVFINNSTVLLGHNKAVTVNSVSVKIPHFSSGFEIKQVTEFK